MPLNLNALRLFDAVARAGSVTRAADLVHVSQPAISKALGQLERGLGVVLFERRARGMRLTEAGTVLAEQARALFGLARTTEEEMRAFRGLQRGTLRVGASTTIGAYVIPPILAQFARKYPDVEMRLMIGNTGEIARRLSAYDLDVALVEGPVTDPRLVAEPWREDVLELIAPRAHPLVGRRVTWSDLEAEVFLLREPGSGTREVVVRGLAAAGFTPRRTVELGSTEAITRSVAAGLGVGFVSHAAAAEQLVLGTVPTLRIPGFHLARTFSRLTVRDRRSSGATSAFEGLLGGTPGATPSAGRAVPPRIRPRKRA